MIFGVEEIHVRIQLVVRGLNVILLYLSTGEPPGVEITELVGWPVSVEGLPFDVGWSMSDVITVSDDRKQN